MNDVTIRRLHATIAAVCPILGVSGAQGSVRIDFDPAATSQQQAAAQAALESFDWSQAADDAWAKAERQAMAAELVDGLVPVTAVETLLRALALVTMDELNILRDWITDFKAAVAGAASLAALKTAVAALPNTPQRTKGQIFPALQARVTSADVG